MQAVTDEEQAKFAHLVSLEQTGALITPTEKQWVIDLAKRLHIPLPAHEIFMARQAGFNVSGLTVQ